MSGKTLKYFYASLGKENLPLVVFFAEFFRAHDGDDDDMVIIHKHGVIILGKDIES